MTEHELGDSSEVVARRVAWRSTARRSLSPSTLFILIYLLQYEAASMIRRSNFRNALSTPAQVPLDGRGPLQGDEVHESRSASSV